MTERINQINRQVAALKNADLLALLNERLADKTTALIGENNEQTRGAVKELRHLLNLPETLLAERQGIAAELPETDSAS